MIRRLLKSVIAKDAKGKHYIRVSINKGVEGLENAIGTQSQISEEVLLQKCIVLDEQGLPALNLAVVKGVQSIAEKREKERLRNERNKREMLKSQLKRRKKED